MPWTCVKCGKAEVADDAACPACGSKKTAWTINEGQTRHFKVTRKADRFELRAGRGDEPGPPSAAEQTARPELEAEAAWSLPRATALDLAKRGLRPAPAHQVTVRIAAKPGADLSVRVTVNYASREPVEQVVPGPAKVEGGGPVDARFVFVHGEGEAVSFPGLHVIDVTDEGGPAKSVAFAAVKKKAREVPVRAVAAEAEAPTTGRLCGHLHIMRKFHGHVFEDRKEDPFFLKFWANHVHVEVVKTPPGVTLKNAKYFTREKGWFDFGEVPAGDYELEITCDGLRTGGTLTMPDHSELDLKIAEPHVSKRAENLKIGKEISPKIAEELQSYNKFEPGSVTSWVSPRLVGIMALYFQVKAIDAKDEVEEIDKPPEAVHLFAPSYSQIRKWARLAREWELGNCSEKAVVAAIQCAGRGLHPVEVYGLKTVDGKKGDHAFCVVGRDPNSRMDKPSTWGFDCVIIDPWCEEVYPASEIAYHLVYFKDREIGQPDPPTFLVAQVRL